MVCQYVSYLVSQNNKTLKDDQNIFQKGHRAVQGNCPREMKTKNRDRKQTQMKNYSSVRILLIIEIIGKGKTMAVFKEMYDSFPDLKETIL